MFRNAFVSVLTLTISIISTSPVWAKEVEGTSRPAGSLGGMFIQTQSSFTGLGNLMIGGAFLAGIGISATGLMKLKSAADSQGREPYSDGLVRLAVGGALCALPAVTNVMTGTLGVRNKSSW